MIAALNLILPPRPTRWGQTQSPLTAANDNCYLYLVGECSRGTLRQHSRSPAFHIHKLAYNSDPEEKTDYIGKVARITTSGGVDSVTYLHADQLGSANTGTTSTGAISWREQYTPFGRTLTSPLVNNDQAGFTGHIKDSATGLNYMQARYFDPLIGRFLSIDPIGFSPERPEMFGRYTYVNNDPVNMIDPTGKIAGKAIKFVRNTIKAKGNPIKGGAETLAGIADDLGTLADGQLNLDDLSAVASLITGLDKKDQKAIGAGVKKLQSKRAAFRKAKMENGVPKSAQPNKTIKPDTPEGNQAGLRRGDNVEMKEFTNGNGETIQIRQDSAASYPDGGTQGPHFNSGMASDDKLKRHDYFKDD